MYNEMTQPHSTHLTDTAMGQLAPSIFADHAHHEVSDRYGFIPTIQVVDALRNVGWYPVSVGQKNSFDITKKDVTKHLVRFRRLDNDLIVNDSVIELLLTNSHDRTSAFVLHAAAFRMACANGIVIADNTINKISVHHTRHAPMRVVKGSHKIIEQVPKVVHAIDGMSQIELSRSEQEIFADTALNYILPEPKNDHPIIRTSRDNMINQLLRPQRRSDNNNSLWATFNTIQEKSLRGGLRLQKESLDKNGRKQYRRSTLREVKSIDRNIKINQALWLMADKMRQLKS